MNRADTASARPFAPLAIAQVVETLDTGGAEHLAIKFANALADRGHESHLYVTSHSGPMAAVIDDKVKVRVFGYRRASIVNPFKFMSSLKDGYAHFRSALKADNVVLVQTHLPTPNFWGLVLQKRGACQSVATIHNNKEFSYGSHRSFRGQMRHRAYREIVTSCAATVAVSDEVRASFLAEIGIHESQAGRLVSIPNGVELPLDRGPAARSKSRLDLGLADEQIACLGVGRICEQKNFKDLVEVGKILKNRAPGITFIIAGDGPDLADLQGRISAAGLTDSIRTLGNITNVPEIMAAADIFVMPSLWEGLPLALLEAMGNRLPIVGNSIGGLHDVVLDQETGFLVAAGDHEAMAARILELATSPSLRRDMGQAGYDVVADRYNLTRVIDSLESLYESIMQR